MSAFAGGFDVAGTISILHVRTYLNRIIVNIVAIAPGIAVYNHS